LGKEHGLKCKDGKAGMSLLVDNPGVAAAGGETENLRGN
jgi:hypothetical protein